MLLWLDKFLIKSPDIYQFYPNLASQDISNALRKGLGRSCRTNEGYCEGYAWAAAGGSQYHGKLFGLAKGHSSSWLAFCQNRGNVHVLAGKPQVKHPRRVAWCHSRPSQLIHGTGFEQNTFENSLRILVLKRYWKKKRRMWISDPAAPWQTRDLPMTNPCQPVINHEKPWV